ncbi:MAG: radical SAM protein [Lachnospiraceae bacterium]|nr:radical SAM protein [Lachnospiraceae bacterium]
MAEIKIAGIERLRMETDGEGVTTLVVSMGCPLRCAYCLNPFTWDNSYAGFKTYTVKGLYDELKIDSLYFLSTGGGIMFGGGEPLLNADFIREFIEEYKSVGWKFYMETSLSVPREKLDKVIDLIDCFVVDTKDMNKERYEKYTLGNYDLFYNNLTYLLEKVGCEKIIARVPKIPIFHKDNEFLENEQFLKDMGFENINVFDYINPEDHKKISEAALKNRDSFIAKIIQ